MCLPYLHINFEVSPLAPCPGFAALLPLDQNARRTALKNILAIAVQYWMDAKSLRQ